MSDRPCNFCNWQRMKKEGGYRRATRADRIVMAEWESDEEFCEAFPSGVVIVDKDGKFASWFAELPSHCCC